MKKSILFFLLITTVYCKAQDVKVLIQNADSLARKNDFKAAAKYDQCIDLVLNHNQPVDDIAWSFLLFHAINVNPENSSKYTDLLYGTRAEKMKDKIAMLSDMGVSSIFSFSYREPTVIVVGTPPYILLDKDKKMLVWQFHESVYFQAFGTFDTYKPLKINDKLLLDLLKDHTKDLLQEKITPRYLKHFEQREYEFVFYSGGAEFKKNMDNDDFVDYQGENGVIWAVRRKPIIDAAHETYQANIKTYFFKLFPLIRLNSSQYWDIINSGTERARVGKFD
jgi:hypothetical protein